MSQQLKLTALDRGHVELGLEQHQARTDTVRLALEVVDLLAVSVEPVALSAAEMPRPARTALDAAERGTDA